MENWKAWIDLVSSIVAFVFMLFAVGVAIWMIKTAKRTGFFNQPSPERQIAMAEQRMAAAMEAIVADLPEIRAYRQNLDQLVSMAIRLAINYGYRLIEHEL